MGVGAGQQEFDRRDSGDMASGGRRQAGARYSAGGHQGGTSKKLIPSYRRARWPPCTRPPGPARPPSRPGFPGCSGPATTDEGQRPRVAVGPHPQVDLLRAAVVALAADQPQPGGSGGGRPRDPDVAPRLVALRSSAPVSTFDAELRFGIMLKREIVLLPEHLYPPEEWRLVEARYSDDYVGRAETIFALANGLLGVRGSFEEGRPALSPGMLVNGFHETWPIIHAEHAHALARRGQTILSVPDATLFKLYVDDEPLFLPTARIQDYGRILDMQAGTLTREFVWATPAGKHVRVRSCRLVSLEHRHVVAMTYEVTLLDHSAPVAISCQVINRQDVRPSDELAEQRPSDPRIATALPRQVLNAQAAELAGQRILLGYQTTNSRMTLGVAVDHVIDAACPYQAVGSVDANTGELVVTVDAPPGVPIRITKYATYQASRSIPVPELVARCGRTLDRMLRDGFDDLLTSQRAHLDRFWDRADVRVQAQVDPVRLQQAIRWNLYQVAQASWRAEGVGIPAKGQTGPGYEGHYFW